MGCGASKKGFQKHYALGALIGSGDFSQVRLCTHLSTNEARCVKMIAKPYNKGDWQYEVALMSAISSADAENESTHVVRFYESFDDHRYYYTVMELCRGGSLLTESSELVEVLTEARVALVMRQTLEALAEIHSKGIVHRDVRPENLCFADVERTQLKLIDFGLSYQITKGEVLSEPCGTPEFIAPEMVLGAYGRKVDLWALGVILYIILFGTPPFHGDTDEDLLRSIVEDEPLYKTPTLVTYEPSNEALSFLRDLLQKDFRLRPTAQEALQHPFLDPAAKKAPVYVPGEVSALRRAGTKMLEDRNTTRLQGGLASGNFTRLISRSSRRKLERRFTRVNVGQFRFIECQVTDLRDKEGGELRTIYSQLLAGDGEYNSRASHQTPDPLSSFARAPQPSSLLITLPEEAEEAAATAAGHKDTSTPPSPLLYRGSSPATSPASSSRSSTKQLSPAVPPIKLPFPEQPKVTHYLDPERHGKRGKKVRCAEEGLPVQRLQPQAPAPAASGDPGTQPVRSPSIARLRAAQQKPRPPSPSDECAAPAPGGRRNPPEDEWDEAISCAVKEQPAEDKNAIKVDDCFGRKQ